MTNTKLIAENLVLRKALENIYDDLRNEDVEITSIDFCSQALASTPETEKMAKRIAALEVLAHRVRMISWEDHPLGHYVVGQHAGDRLIGTLAKLDELERE